MVWRCPPQPKLICWNPNVQRDDIKKLGFWGGLGHEGGLLMSGISALIKEKPQSFLSPSITWGHKEKFATW